ncbi:hypothetical protein ACXG98_001884 [Pseudomonas aeruginosa]|nr:hypothetical protein [Pseudomonas aeruginosa]
MDIKDIPEDLLCHMDNWLRGSFEETLDYMDGWINFSIESVYTKNKSAAVLDDIKDKIRTGKLTTEHISEYHELIEDSGERDNRYLHPIYLSGYIVARARAKQYHNEKNHEKTMSALCCLSYYAGAMYESSQLNRAGVPTYMFDPKRVKISSNANDAAHAGTNIVKKMVTDLIIEERPDKGWYSRKVAAAQVAEILTRQLYIPKDPPPPLNSKEETHIPRLDLEFKLNLKASSLHERILKWMGAGEEGVDEINKAIKSTLKSKAK